jgi:hypothetical protein
MSEAMRDGAAQCCVRNGKRVDRGLEESEEVWSLCRWESLRVEDFKKRVGGNEASLQEAASGREAPFPSTAPAPDSAIPLEAAKKTTDTQH